MSADISNDTYLDYLDNTTNTNTDMSGNETLLSSVDASLKVLMQNTDSFFLIIMGIIVFLMQCGFAFLEAGAVR
jgi:hypothetical protein